MNFKQEFGQTCKAARLALNLTTSELAARVGMSRQQIVNIESGRSFPGYVDCLLNALNIDCKFTPPGKIVKIEVYARGWWHKSAGNSYFSAWVHLHRHGMPLLSIPLHFQYGSGESYLDAALFEIQKAGFFTNADKYARLWRICEKEGIELIHNRQDGHTEREVKAYTR